MASRRKWLAAVKQLAIASRGMAFSHWALPVAGKKLHGEEVVVEFDAPLPVWSLVSSANQWFVGLGFPPFKRESLKGSCSPEQPFSGSVLAFLRD